MHLGFGSGKTKKGKYWDALHTQVSVIYLVLAGTSNGVMLNLYVIVYNEGYTVKYVLVMFIIMLEALKDIR